MGYSALFTRGATLLFLLFVTFSAHGESEGKALVDSVVGRFDNLRYLRCRMHQTVEQTGAPTRSFEGALYYRAPRFLRLHFFSPTEEVVVLNDSAAVFYSVKETEGFRYPLDMALPGQKRIFQQIDYIRRQMLRSMAPRYEFTVVDSSSRSDVRLSARPHGGWDRLSKIELSVNAEDYYLNDLSIYDTTGVCVFELHHADHVVDRESQAAFPRSVSVTERFGTQTHETAFRFSRIRMNTPVPDSLFTFTPPPQGTLHDLTAK